MPWKKTFFQPLRFALSGGLATASHWLVMAFMVNAGTTPTLATAAGASIGAIINYILQRKVTFKSRIAHRTALLRYLTVVALTWFANLIFFLFLHRIVLLTPVYAQGITSLTVALMSYFLYKRIVFNERQSQPVY